MDDNMREIMIERRKAKFDAVFRPSTDRDWIDGEMVLEITTNGNQWQTLSLAPWEIPKVAALLNAHLAATTAPSTVDVEVGDVWHDATNDRQVRVVSFAGRYAFVESVKWKQRTKVPLSRFNGKPNGYTLVERATTTDTAASTGTGDGTT